MASGRKHGTGGGSRAKALSNDRSASRQSFGEERNKISATAEEMAAVKGVSLSTSCSSLSSFSAGESEAVEDDVDAVGRVEQVASICQRESKITILSLEQMPGIV